MRRGKVGMYRTDIQAAVPSPTHPFSGPRRKPGVIAGDKDPPRYEPSLRDLPPVGPPIRGLPPLPPDPMRPTSDFLRIHRWIFTSNVYERR